MRQQIAALFVFLLVVPRLAAGQTPMPGDRVRFSHPGEGTRTGTVVAYTPDTLEVLIAGRAEASHLPLDQVTRLDVSYGKERQPMRRAGIGLLVGAGVGAVGGFASGSDDCQQELICISRGGGAILGGVFFGAVGGAIGLIAGVVPSDKWQRVPLERRRVSFIAPGGSHGSAVGLRVAF